MLNRIIPCYVSKRSIQRLVIRILWEQAAEHIIYTRTRNCYCYDDSHGRFDDTKSDSGKKIQSSHYIYELEQETERLLKQIINGRNTALVSYRRMRKTGLIFLLFNQEEAKRIYYTNSILILFVGRFLKIIHTMQIGCTVRRYICNWNSDCTSFLGSKQAVRGELMEDQNHTAA